MTDDLTSVAYGGDLAKPVEGQHVLRSTHPFEATVARLKEAVVAEGLWVLHEIDPQMLLRKGGFAIAPTRQILFFHPRYMARLLAAAPAAIVEAPLKLAVMAGVEGDGGAVVRYPDPQVAFARHGAEMAALGSELAGACARIVASVAPVGEGPP